MSFKEHAQDGGGGNRPPEEPRSLSSHLVARSRAVYPSETEEDLRERLASLQTRLDEAEETLLAWRSGGVDSVVASGPDGDCVYTLKGADKAYRLMVQTMTEGALTLTLDGIILFSNQQFASMLGTPLERVIGSSLRDFITAEDAATVCAMLADPVAQKVEIRLKKAPGSRVSVQISANRLQFDGIECVCLIVTDLTQLRDSEERYRLLVESLQDYAILMLDPQGLVTSWNSAAQKIKGYCAEEIVGQSFERFYTRADVEKGRPLEVLRLAKINGHFEEDGWRVRKDGSRFWANVTITALSDDSGGLRGFSKVVRDISARKRIEQELKESEEQFRLLLECAPVAIVIVNESGQLALVNAQAEKLFGYQRNELVGQPVEALLPAGDRNDHIKYRLAYGQSPRPRQMGTGLALRGLRKSGEKFPVEVSLSPIRTQGGSWVAAGIRDITERMDAESRLIAERRRAEDANRAKSAFLATMSHEIRTPLNAILGMADLLWETELNQIQRDYVGRFRRAGTNLLTLINDILDLSKIESGKFELESIDFFLSDLLTRTAELLTPRANMANIELAVQTVLGTPPVLTGDPLRLQQVLNNIVGNAIKFTEKGSVTLTVKPHRDNRPGHLQFMVADTGIGISPEKITSIFDDFSQAENSTTRRFGGTGLGLGICRRLVNRMGGDLTVESVLGKGSVFTFDVILSLPGRSLEADENKLSQLAGGRVIVVDRNGANRLNLCQTCSAWGMIPFEADTPAKAGELLRQALESGQSFALVLLDDATSGADLFVDLKQLLAIDASLPIVLTNSDRQLARLSEALAFGAAATVPRPFSRAELLTSISAVLRRNGERDRHLCNVREQAEAATKAAVMRILIADDSEDNRFLLAAYLANSPYELTFVENGQEAVDMFASRPFDLVLMDMHMPVVDGLSSTEAIRALERERAMRPVPIVALTADALNEDVARTQAVGCSAHLAKPISKEKLVGAIESFRCG